MTRQNANLYAHFQRHIDASAEKELLRDTNEQIVRYRDVDQRSAQIANFLLSRGARPGDRVSVQVDKSPECLCLYLACLRSGLVFHPLNMAYTDNELAHFFGNAEPAVVVCDSARRESIERIALPTGAREVLTLDADGSGSLVQGADGSNGKFETVQCDRDDLAALLYSSGTTGVPKGIMLTHANLLHNTEALVEAWEFTQDDRLLHALPIFHVHGLFVAIGCVLLSGASMRWLAAFNADEVIRYLPECTVLMGVPTYYTRLLASPDFNSDVAQHMRLFVSGSAPLLEETFLDFEKRTEQRILERYGMTETNMNTSNPLHGARKPGTVGPALPGVDVRVVDEAGNAVASGEIGNLQVRGPNVFIGYWRMPEKTAEDFTEDGYFDTGDKASIDTDDYVSIVGRARDLVITGGLNVYPKEVELFVDELDEVRESAVIGVPHADFGEAVVAVVVPAKNTEVDEQSIIAACKESLANFKVPKRVVIVNALPRNTMSKVQKNVLREQYADLLASS